MSKQKRILILSTYPAPYRVKLFESFFSDYAPSLFFEHGFGDQRNANWFSSGSYFLLDTKEGKREYKFAKKRIKQFDIVALYEFSTVKSIGLIIKCRLAGIPYTINSDGVILEKHGNILREVLKTLLISGAAACLASGKNAKEYFLKYGAKEKNICIHTFSTLEKDDVLTSPLAPEKKLKKRETIALPTEGFIAIAVGRFIPLKRYKELIFAWKQMPKNYTLLLIGGREEESEYRRIIEENKLSNVIIEGFHSKEELFEYYKAADVFVHPTSYDVWGLVVNEAMACGLPVIVSDRCVAGLELIHNGQNGYLVSMGNDNELCRRVIDVCSDPKKYSEMASSALETIRPYTIENMAKTHIDVFKEITGCLE